MGWTAQKTKKRFSDLESRKSRVCPAQRRSLLQASLSSWSSGDDEVRRTLLLKQQRLGFPSSSAPAARPLPLRSSYL